MANQTTPDRNKRPHPPRQHQHQQGQPPRSFLQMPSTLAQLLIISVIVYLFWADILPDALPPEWRDYATAVGLSIIAFFGVVLISRFVHPIHHINQVIAAYRHTDTHGSARFAHKDDIKDARLNRPEGLWVGQFEDLVLRFKNETHTLVISPAGGGKTVYIVIPQLGIVDMPMLVTDMKGELTAITGRWRERHMGHRVRVINPPPGWHAPTDSYNPCDLVVEALLTDPRDTMIDARGIANQLLPEPPKADANAFFRHGSRDIITFAITAVAVDQPALCSLPTIQGIVGNPLELRGLCEVMKNSTALGGDVANLASSLLNAMDTTPREFQSFLNNANQALGPFVSSGRIAQFCRTSTFRFRELKTGDATGKPVTIYNCCDMTRAKQFAPWVGLLNWAAMVELQRTPVQRHVLILMDEASNFVIPDLPNYLTALRGYGISVFLVFQEHAEIERVYGKEAAATMWSQADLTIGFGIKSIETAKKFSERAGNRTIETTNFQMGQQAGQTVGSSRSHTQRPLLNPDEITRLDADRMMVFIKNLPVIMATRCGYHEIEPLRSGLDPNPFHGNKPYTGDKRLIL